MIKFAKAKSSCLLALFVVTCPGISLKESAQREEYSFGQAIMVADPTALTQSRYFSEATQLAEHRGLTHWLIYTDGKSLLA